MPTAVTSPGLSTLLMLRSISEFHTHICNCPVLLGAQSLSTSDTTISLQSQQPGAQPAFFSFLFLRYSKLLSSVILPPTGIFYISCFSPHPAPSLALPPPLSLPLLLQTRYSISFLGPQPFPLFGLLTSDFIIF